MSNGPQPPRSCLAKLQPVRLDLEEAKRSGWKQHGILVVDESDPRLGWPEKEMVKHLAKKLFGHPADKDNPHG